MVGESMTPKLELGIYIDYIYSTLLDVILKIIFYPINVSKIEFDEVRNINKSIFKNTIIK